jgi:serine/threonine-protein kinase
MDSGSGTDIAIYDSQRDSFSKLTVTAKGNNEPIWAPDGKHLVFASGWGEGSGLNWIRADGVGEPHRLLESKTGITPFSFSPDGRHLAYFELGSGTGFDIWILPLDLSDPDDPKAGTPEPFLRTPFTEFHPVFSHDGRWLAYTSNESGAREVYVRRFSADGGGSGGKWQISSGGGYIPMWSRNGRELFYETLDNRIMVADYTVSGDSFIAGKPRSWSNMQLLAPGRTHADLAPDGKRFVVFPMPATAGDEKGSPYTFLLNFFDEVRRRIPEGK